MRILALVPGGIGDQLLFFPTLADLKERYPEAMIDVLVEPRAKAAYRVCPYVHEALTFDFKDRNGPADFLNILGTIRDREYEVALSLGRSWVVSLLLWLNGIPTRVGYQSSPLSFISHPVPLNSNQYIAQQYHDLLKGLGLDTPCQPLSINVPNTDIQWAEGEQKRLGLTEGYVLLHGGIGDTNNKRYPAEQWQSIIEDIQSKQPNLPVVLLQGLEDPTWVNDLLAITPSLKVSMPEDVGKLAAMIAGANLMVCSDSAPLHLAVAVGTYTVALFGETQQTQRLPQGNDKLIGIQSSTGRLADIQSHDVLAQIWRG